MKQFAQPDVNEGIVEVLDEQIPEIEYPCSDGVAWSETDFQARAVHNARHFLKTHFRNRSDVYISGNIFVYYQRGNPALSVSPDILVALGVERRDRRTYRTWVEGKAPDFVLEVLSPSTARKDLTTKRDIYAKLGVREYFLFDPAGDRLQPPLQGYQLDWGRYVPLPALEPLAVRSGVLGLDLWVDDLRHLRMRDASTGENLPSMEESEEGRRKAESREESARIGAREAQARANQAEARASQAETRASEAEARASEAEARASRAEARVAELEARLDKER